MNRGVSKFSKFRLGAHYESIDFKEILNNLCGLLLELTVFVKTDKPSIAHQVNSILRAVDIARDSVLELYVQYPDEWEKIVRVIVALHDSMDHYTYNDPSFKISGLTGICGCILDGTKIDNTSNFVQSNDARRNGALLDILTKIGHNLRSTSDGYSDLFGHRGGQKMQEIIALLIGPLP